MNNALLVYEGYSPMRRGNSYKSLIEDKWQKFDTASQWVQYINYIKGVKR